MCQCMNDAYRMILIIRLNITRESITRDNDKKTSIIRLYKKKKLKHVTQAFKVVAER